MPDRDCYEAWRRSLAEASVPDDFADRVMASIHRQQQRPRPWLAGVLQRLLGSPTFRLGVCSLACAAGFLRILQVIALFLAEQASR